jgi:cobalt-zinc-cadmium efflux system outer membrane protein
MRPDLAVARAEQARLESEAGLTRRRGLVPNPVLKGFYRQELFDERVAGGEISVPLPVWNREQGTETALRAQAAAAAADVQRLALEIPREVHVALVRRSAAGEAWRRYRRETLPAIGAARELLERGEAAGYVALPERLVQQDRLLAAETAAIDAWRDLHLAEADLIEAVGGTPP